MSKAWQIKHLPWSSPALLYITLCGEVTSAQEDDSVVVIDAHQITSSCAAIQHALFLFFFLGHSCTDKGLGKYCTMNDKHRASTVSISSLTICVNTQCLSSSTFGFNAPPSIFNCHSRHPPPGSPFTLHSPEPLKSGDSAPLFTPDHSSPSAPPSTLRSVDRHACTSSAKTERGKDSVKSEIESDREGLSFWSSYHSCSSVNSAIPEGASKGG